MTATATPGGNAKAIEFFEELREAERQSHKRIRRYALLPAIAGTLWFAASLYSVYHANNEARRAQTQAAVAMGSAKYYEGEQERLKHSNALLHRENDNLEQDLKTRKEELRELDKARQSALEVSTKNPNQALAQIRQVLVNAAPEQSAANSARSLWSQGYAAYQAGNMEGARKFYEQSLQANPNYAPALNSLGRLAGERGDTKEEERLYREAINRDPAYAPAQNNLALVCLDTGRLDEAETWAKKALAARPGWASAKDVLTAVNTARDKLRSR